jgi:TetR/AcrR family transcriptional regulator, transcriptional repressor for nem operon
MARPPSFDRHKALDAALKLFWRQGYLVTSLPDLLAEMAIARSSFYATFSDKRSLFIECLDLFGDRTRQILLEADRGEQSLGAIRHFFDTTVTNAPPHRVSMGCMMVNSILELADVDPELKNLAQHKLDQIQDEFERLLINAQVSGEIDRSLDIAKLADALMTLNLGIRVQSRKHENRAHLKQSIDTSLAAFGIAA